MRSDPIRHASSTAVHAAATEAFARKLAHARSLPWFCTFCPQIRHVQTAEDLHRLPILSVEDEQGGLLFTQLGEASHRAPGGGLTLTSGGSTGNRKHITHSWAFNESIVPLGARMFAASDEHPRVVINCLTPGEVQGAFQYASAIVQHIGARLLPAGALMGAQRIAGLIHSQAADALICTPSFAAALFNHADVDKAQLSSLRWLYYIGEPCHQPLREQLARDWPALSIRSLGYSSTETGPIGFQCAHLEHGFYHLHADAMLLEVVDPVSLRAVADGETGEFLLTPLLPDHAPLLRYRIDDRGRILGRQSDCANTGAAGASRNLDQTGRCDHHSAAGSMCPRRGVARTACFGCAGANRSTDRRRAHVAAHRAGEIAGRCRTRYRTGFAQRGASERIARTARSAGLAGAASGSW
jgi:phenylacetate-CoA ligase